MAKDKHPGKEEKRVFGLTQKQRSWIYTTLFIITFIVFFIVNNSGEEPESGPYPPGYEAKFDPALLLTDLSGGSILLEDYKEKVVVIDFWVSWNKKSTDFVQQLIELKDEYSDKDFEIIGIALDTDTKQNVKPFVESSGINYPVVYGDGVIMQKFGGVRTVPTTFVLDKEGRIYNKYVNGVNKEILKNDINKLLGE